MTYSHRQVGGLHWLLGFVAVGMVVLALALASIPFAWIAPVVAAAICVLFYFCFGSLTVEDAGEALDVRFGPLPLFRTRIAYERIEAVRVGRSSLVDGLGVHWVPGRGWTYNLWGFDCVELTVDGGRTIRIGSDDATGLAAFLETRIADAPSRG